MMSALPATAADDGTEGRGETTNNIYLRTLEAENDHLREQLRLAAKDLSQRAHYTKELESKVSDLLRSLRKKSSITQIKARIAILESLLKNTTLVGVLKMTHLLGMNRFIQTVMRA